MVTHAEYWNLERKGFSFCAAHGALYTQTDNVSGKGCGRCVIDRTRDYGADRTVINPRTNKRYGKAVRRRIVAALAMSWSADVAWKNRNATTDRMMAEYGAYYTSTDAVARALDTTERQ